MKDDWWLDFAGDCRQQLTMTCGGDFSGFQSGFRVLIFVDVNGTCSDALQTPASPPCFSNWVFGWTICDVIGITRIISLLRGSSKIVLVRRLQYPQVKSFLSNSLFNFFEKIETGTSVTLVSLVLLSFLTKSNLEITKWMSLGFNQNELFFVTSWKFHFRKEETNI